MFTIKSIGDGRLFELPYDIAYEVMGDLYREPSREDRLDGVDACVDGADEVAWLARVYEAMERIESAREEAMDDVRDEVGEAYGLYGDWECVQRKQCELLGLDLETIYGGVDISDYEC